MQQLQRTTGPHCPCNNDFLTTVQLRGKPLWPFRLWWGKRAPAGVGWVQAPVLRRAQCVGGVSVAQCRIRYAGERCGGLGETTVTWGAKAALSSCPSPMRAGSSQGTPLGNGRAPPGLEGSGGEAGVEASLLGLLRAAAPGPRAQPPQWRPSVSARVQVSRDGAARGPRDGTGRPGQAGSGGCGGAGSGGARRARPAAQAQQPLGPRARVRAGLQPRERGARGGGRSRRPVSAGEGPR